VSISACQFVLNSPSLYQHVLPSFYLHAASPIHPTSSNIIQGRQSFHSHPTSSFHQHTQPITPMLPTSHLAPSHTQSHHTHTHLHFLHTHTPASHIIANTSSNTPPISPSIHIQPNSLQFTPLSHFISPALFSSSSVSLFPSSFTHQQPGFRHSFAHSSSPISHLFNQTSHSASVIISSHHLLSSFSTFSSSQHQRPSHTLFFSTNTLSHTLSAFGIFSHLGMSHTLGCTHCNQLTTQHMACFISSLTVSHSVPFALHPSIHPFPAPSQSHLSSGLGHFASHSSVVSWSLPNINCQQSHPSIIAFQHQAQPAGPLFIISQSITPPKVFPCGPLPLAGLRFQALFPYLVFFYPNLSGLITLPFFFRGFFPLGSFLQGLFSSHLPGGFGPLLVFFTYLFFGEFFYLGHIGGFPQRLFPPEHGGFFGPWGLIY